MKKRFLPLIFCLSLVLPAYTASLPGDNPVSGKGSTSSAKKTAEKVAEKAIVIRTAPKDAKGDQVTVGKNGEILVPQSGQANRFRTSATVNRGPVIAEASVPQKPEESAPQEAEERGETKTARKKDDSKGAGNVADSTNASRSKEREEDRGLLGSGEGMAVGGFPSNLPGTGGGVLDGLLPSTSTGTTFPDATTNTSTDTGTTNTPTLLGPALQALLERSVSDTGIPGAILAVQTKDGVWTVAAGKADVDANVSMTSDMQVRIAGVTKVFTAALIMKLVEENKIALTDTVQKWLPNLIVPGTVPYSAQITVAMLLNHTSGLYDYVGDQYFTDLLLSDPYYAWPSDSTYDEIIYWIYDTAFLPGTAFGYCNAGYYLLGKIAEAATGNTDTVENMVKTRFFDPLTMSKTTLTRGGQFDQTEPYTRGYCWIDVNYYPTLVDTSKLVDTSDWDLSWDWTSGSGVSTAQDILAWTKALFGGQVVNAQSLTQMTTPLDPSSFGYGLEVSDQDPWFGEKMYGLGGENPGAAVRWLYYPDSGRTIFLALNRFDSYATTQMDVSQVADSILSGVGSILSNATP
jgi:D-alanyl-D-alanine carboxypeptidase